MEEDKKTKPPEGGVQDNKVKEGGSKGVHNSLTQEQAELLFMLDAQAKNSKYRRKF